MPAVRAYLLPEVGLTKRKFLLKGTFVGCLLSACAMVPHFSIQAKCRILDQAGKPRAGPGLPSPLL